MSQENFIEVPENEQTDDIELSQPKKKRELSQKQIEHLNNIRIKALEKKEKLN